MPGNAFQEALIRKIAAQIEEAEREAVEKENVLNKAGMEDAEDDGYRKGFNAAKEKAKGIALIYGLQMVCGHDHDECQKKSASLIADRISQMSPEDDTTVGSMEPEK